jgi:hypothetical protein
LYLCQAQIPEKNNERSTIGYTPGGKELMGLWDWLFRKKSAVSVPTLPPPKPKRVLSEADRAWQVLQRQAIQHAKAKDWGLYTNVRLDMAGQLRREGNAQRALDGFLEVLYLDMNGPGNSGAGWEPALAVIAPAVVEWAWKECGNCEVDDVEELKQGFLKKAAKQYEALSLPISPENAWPQIRDALELAKASESAKRAGLEDKRIQRDAERDARRAVKAEEKAIAKAQRGAVRAAKRGGVQQ